MRRDSTITILLVLGEVMIASLRHGYVVGILQAPDPDWIVAFEAGVATGAVLAVWRFVRSRRTAVVGIGLAALVAVAMDVIGLDAGVVSSLLGWAILLTLVVRLIKPEPTAAADWESTQQA